MSANKPEKKTARPQDAAGSMSEEQILSLLEELVAQVGVSLRYEKGDFKGGLCRVGEQKIMIVHKSLHPAQKIRIMCQELARLDLSQIFIPPKLRELIEQAAPKKDEVEG